MYICSLNFKQMSAASVQKPSSSQDVTSDYMSPIKIFGHAKAEIGDIFSEISGYVGDSISLLNGWF